MRLQKKYYLLLLLYPQTVFAVDLQTILTNLQNIVVPFMYLILTISFVSGVYLVFRALGELKQFGMATTHMARQGELAGPLIHLVVGTVLIYLPTTTDIVTQTLFQDEGAQSIFTGGTINLTQMYNEDAASVILGYSSVTLSADWDALINTIILYVQFIGFLAFVRGWFLVSKAGQPGNQPNTVKRGIVHVVGGIIAINVVPAYEILYNTVFSS